MRAAAILIFDKCLYLQGRLRLITARRLSAYMSSRALATSTWLKCIIMCSWTMDNKDHKVVKISSKFVKKLNFEYSNQR